MLPVICVAGTCQVCEQGWDCVLSPRACSKASWGPAIKPCASYWHEAEQAGKSLCWTMSEAEAGCLITSCCVQLPNCLTLVLVLMG